jgi:hypothetical protein
VVHSSSVRIFVLIPLDPLLDQSKINNTPFFPAYSYASSVFGVVQIPAPNSMFSGLVPNIKPLTKILSKGPSRKTFV